MLSKVFTRSDMPAEGVDDMICLSDLSEGSLLWNLKIRYENNQIYVRLAALTSGHSNHWLTSFQHFRSKKTYTGSILIAVNPYKMFDIYNLDMVKKYENHLFGTLPP